MSMEAVQLLEEPRVDWARALQSGSVTQRPPPLVRCYFILLFFSFYLLLLLYYLFLLLLLFIIIFWFLEAVLPSSRMTQLVDTEGSVAARK